MAKCPSCGVELAEIFVHYKYTISYNEKQGKWTKDEGDVTYVCGSCVEELDVRDIEDILRQVGEL